MMRCNRGSSESFSVTPFSLRELLLDVILKNKMNLIHIKLPQRFTEKHLHKVIGFCCVVCSFEANVIQIPAEIRYRHFHI